MTITVSDDEMIVSPQTNQSDYNTDLLEEHLIGFLTIQAGLSIIHPFQFTDLEAESNCFLQETLFHFLGHTALAGQ
ncbi:hypothetical protein ABIB50_003862 [Mucilaginibacter sp. UYCu711]